MAVSWERGSWWNRTQDEKLHWECWGLFLYRERRTHQYSVCIAELTWLNHVESSVVQLCLTLCDPWTAARQASLSIINSRSLLKLMSIRLVMPSNHLVLCCPLLLLPSIFPSIRVFSNEFLISGGQSIAVSASASVLPMNIQDWFPLGWTG